MTVTASGENIAGDPKPSPAAHTPGPWEYQKDRNAVFGPEFMLIKMVAGDSQDNIDANARLIAAAPEMLDALVDALSSTDADLETGRFMLSGRGLRAYEKVKAAIAKATGGA